MELANSHLASARASVRELQEKIEIARERRDYFVGYLQELWHDVQKGRISKEFYLKTEYREFDGKTIREWAKYYDSYIKECETLLRRHKKEIAKGHFFTLFFSAVIIVLIAFLFSSFFELRFVGFVILSEVNGTFLDDFEDGNISDWTLTAASGANNCTASTIDPMNGSWHVNCQPQSTSEPASIIEIDINTTGYENITFSYYRKLVGLDVADEFKAKWNNGTAWIVVEETLSNSANDASYVFKTFNLTADANNNSNFKIRFECTAGATSERCRLDNVGVTGAVTPPDTTNPIINSISDSPDPVVKDSSITITANITDNAAVDSALVEINGTNHTMIKQSTLLGIEEILFADDFDSGTLNTKEWFLNSTGDYWGASAKDPMNGTHHAEAHQTGAGNPSYMEVDASTFGYANITFSYYRKLVGLDVADEFKAEWYNGTSWTAIEETLGDSANDAGYVFKTFNLTADANNNQGFKVRFMCETGAVTEDCRLDNVTVRGIISVSDAIWKYNYNNTISLGTFNYAVYANDTSNNNAISQAGNFTVVEANITVSETVRDSNDTAINTTLEIEDENSSVVYNETRITHLKKLPKGNYTIKIKPDNHKIKEISFNDLSVTEDTSDIINIDDPENNQGFSELFSVDSLINFTSAVLTINATGNKLYECNNWNFTSQICNGNWTLARSGLVPGTLYNYVLTSDSPRGYAEIIIITNAEHLNSSREFISDIYPEVKELDNIWSETIPANDYVRVTFEAPLDNTRDITIYPRIVSGNPKIEVYEVNGNNLIAEFTTINSNQYNKVFLDGSSGAGLPDGYSQEVFDLKIVSGSVEFDHIIDPTQTWTSALLFSFDDDDGAPATYTAEILDSGADQPSFGGTLTKVAVMVDVTTGTSIDAGEGTNFYHCETSACTSSYPIGGITGTQLNTEGVFWVNSTDATLLARFEHDGVDSEFLKGNETADGLDGGENLNYDAYVLLDYDTVPTWSSNSSNGTIAGEYINHQVNWNDDIALSGYIFEFDNGTGSFTNDSFVSMTGTSNTSSVTKLVNFTKGSTIRWRVYANDSLNQKNSTSLFTYATTGYGTLNVSISSPADNSGYFTGNTNLTVNATVSCVGSAGDVCGTVSALARYNASSANPDTAINATSGATPFYIMGGGTVDTLAYWRPINWTIFNSGTSTVTSPENASDLNYNDTATLALMNGVDNQGDPYANYTFDLPNSISNAKLYYTWACSSISSNCIIYAWNFSAGGFAVIEVSGGHSTTTASAELSGGYINSTGGAIIKSSGSGGAFGSADLSLYDIHITTTGNTYDYRNITNPSTTLNATYNESIATLGASCTNGWCLGNEFVNNNSNTTDTAYNDVWLIENEDRNSTSTTGEINMNSFENYHFRINESESNVDSFTFEWRGDYMAGSAVGVSLFYIDLWNSSSWVRFFRDNSSVTLIVTDMIFSQEITDSVADYIDSDSYIHMRVVTGSTAPNVAIIETDYVKVNIVSSGGASNPQTSPSLSAGGFFYPNWTLNVTSSTAEAYLLDVKFNSSYGNSKVPDNDTANRQVNLNPAGAANNPPTIPFVQVISATDPSIGSFKSITFNFTARDTDGASNLNDSAAAAYFQRASEATRSNTSCSTFTAIGNDKNYSCTVNMWYFDQPGSWTINVTIRDINSATGANSSTFFTYNLLTAMNMSPTALTWPAVSLTDTDIEANQNITINNTGNDVDLSVNVTARDLRGETTTTQYIYSNNFTVNNVTADPCNVIEMVNATSTNVTNAILQRGNNSLNYWNATSGQEQTVYCLQAVLPTISAQSYSTSALGAWTVAVVT